MRGNSLCEVQVAIFIVNTMNIFTETRLGDEADDCSDLSESKVGDDTGTFVWWANPILLGTNAAAKRRCGAVDRVSETVTE